MATNKQYDQEFKVQAVKLAQEIGQAKAASELGMILSRSVDTFPTRGTIASLIVASFCQTLISYAAAAYISFAVL